MILNAAFSFGRDRDLVHRFQDHLAGVHIHDLHSDVDANRTWLSISGDEEVLYNGFTACCADAFDRIDIGRQATIVSRTGALDYAVCDGKGSAEFAARLGRRLAEIFEIPVFGEKASETWAVLHEQGFGKLLNRDLAPDYGPLKANEKLGIALVAPRPFFILVAIDVLEERAEFCSLRVRDIRNRRMEGEAMFAGVEAVAYPAPSDGRSRMLIEFGDPDVAGPDPVIEWLTRRTKGAGIAVGDPRLIGAIRQVDLLETRCIPVRPDQIIREYSGGE